MAEERLVMKYGAISSKDIGTECMSASLHLNNCATCYQYDTCTKACRRRDLKLDQLKAIKAAAHEGYLNTQQAVSDYIQGI